MKKILLTGGLILSFISCSAQKADHDTKDLVNATAWMQNAGEYKALTIQAYQLAQIRLAQILTQEVSEKPRAIVLDIDETVLDNSPYQAYQIENKKNFNQEDWNKWTRLALAEPIAGALNFLNFTKNNGVEIFYVSNRSEAERVPTLENLQKKNFPYADNDHLILKTDKSSKESRRQKLSEKYNIVLFFGDNLSDFSDMYYYNNDGKTSSEKVLEHPELFGSKFIILPNAMYGDWESSIYKKNTDKKLSNEQVKMKSLRSFTTQNINQ